MTPRHDENARRFLIAEPDGEAFVSYDREGDTVTITHTFVPPQWRGRGVGALLLEALLTWTRDNALRVASTCSYATAWLAKRGE